MCGALSLKFGFKASVKPQESNQKHNWAGGTNLLSLLWESNNWFLSNKSALGSTFYNESGNKIEDNALFSEDIWDYKLCI